MSAAREGPSLQQQPSKLNETVRRLSNAARRTFGKDVHVANEMTLKPSEHPVVPSYLLQGVQMLKISTNKRSQRTVRLLPSEGQMSWQSNSLKSALLSESGWAFLNLEAIIELRFGAEAATYRQQTDLAADVEPRWMTVIYLVRDGSERRVKMLHLVAMDQEVANAWRETLQVMVAERKAVMTGDLRDDSERWRIWVSQCWQMTDGDGDQKASFLEVAHLCKRLGILADEARLKEHFQAVDIEQKGYLTLKDFQVFVRRMRHRKEIASLVQKLTSDPDGLSLDLFTSFLHNEQKSTLADDRIATLFKKYSISEPLDKLTVEEFTDFFCSADNSPFPRERIHVTQDMSRPLCEYFVSSSHNTYLVGNQLNGSSSTEGYIRALQQGCRCVELDVWNGSDGQPIIYHGRTLTSKIALKAVLQAIAKYAFVSSPYPVILSLEVHCDTNQQDIMARLFREHLGAALLDKVLFEDDLQTLPSPEQLKGRILIKAKNLFEVSKEEPVRPRLVTVNTDSASETTTTTADSSDGELKRKFDNALQRVKSSPSSPSSKDANLERVQSTPSKAPMSAALAALIIYTIGVKCRGFNKKEVYHPFHVLSLGERRLGKTLKEAKSDLLAHNRTHLVRSYPAGFRFTSSNYLPQTLWAVGVQLVAINWQTYDLGAEINGAFFKRNGGCGYILKPDFLRMKSPLAKDKEVLSAPCKMTLRIQILSAQQLTRTSAGRSKRDSVVEPAPLSPFVEVALFAPGVDTSKAPRKKTPPVKGNGFNPTFADSTFDLPFEVVGRMLDLVFVQIQVFDSSGESDRPIARCCISLGELRSGYRHLPLYDQIGQEFLFSSLFVHTKIIEPT